MLSLFENVEEYKDCFFVLITLGISLLIRLTIPTIVVFLEIKSFAELVDVKKLSHVIFLPLPKNGAVRFRTT